MSNQIQFRQGDVLLQQVDQLPPDAQEIPADGRVVLRHGEATGHAHAFYDTGAVRLYETPSGGRYLRVVQTDALLRHEEHQPISIPPGLYKLPTQMEWSDDDEPIVVQD